jgi:hypothetical protein
MAARRAAPQRQATAGRGLVASPGQSRATAARGGAHMLRYGSLPLLASSWSGTHGSGRTIRLALAPSLMLFHGLGQEDRLGLRAVLRHVSACHCSFVLLHHHLLFSSAAGISVGAVHLQFGVFQVPSLTVNPDRRLGNSSRTVKKKNIPHGACGRHKHQRLKREKTGTVGSLRRGNLSLNCANWELKRGKKKK